MPDSPPLLLCVLHPAAAVRSVLLTRCPRGVQTAEVASPAELAAVQTDGPVVVLLDPARTDPAAVLASRHVRPQLVSISDLRLPAKDAGVDAVLPLRRLSEGFLWLLLADLAERRSVLSA